MLPHVVELDPGGSAGDTQLPTSGWAAGVGTTGGGVTGAVGPTLVDACSNPQPTVIVPAAASAIAKIDERMLVILQTCNGTNSYVRPDGAHTGILEKNVIGQIS